MREFDLLEHIYASNARLDAGTVLIPPGDDMGMVRADRREILAAVDQAIDGRHFRLATTPIELVGRKAVTRSLSDIAAMAARPLATLVAATLPPDFGEGRANALFDAMRGAAAAYRCPLIGGDLAFHSSPAHPLVCSVTVLATPGPTPPARRDGAKAGDAVFVTGRLGGSLEPSGLGRHLTFEPRIDLALEIANRLGPALHSMIDLSDGLGRDVSHVGEFSGVQIVLEAASIPCNEGCDWRRALSDGEDYELCFTTSDAGNVPAEIGGVPITRVGEVMAAAARPRVGSSHVLVREGGCVLAADEMGWQHGGSSSREAAS